jgi:quercetin dioxygenase-like cupin family protein
MPDRAVDAGDVQLSCDSLDDTLAFFIDRLGFRLESISPADNPRAAVISGQGLRIRLVRTADPPLVVPPERSGLVVTRADTDAPWVVGRAGMRYRDLVPGRQGGRVIASHICIPHRGPVPDYVHFHKVQLQLIYCYRGWVRVVYEDQGPPFVLSAGDCVLQPPEIRHRVLGSSPGMEVIEITSPAEHDTFVDHDLALPTPVARPERDFSGQRFVRHESSSAAWRPWRLEGFEHQDTGIAAATGGQATVVVARSHGHREPAVSEHHGELLFMFVLDGEMTLHCDGHAPERLYGGGAVVVPPDKPYTIGACSDDLTLLEVACDRW